MSNEWLNGKEFHTSLQLSTMSIASCFSSPEASRSTAAFDFHDVPDFEVSVITDFRPTNPPYRRRFSTRRKLCLWSARWDGGDKNLAAIEFVLPISWGDPRAPKLLETPIQEGVNALQTPTKVRRRIQTRMRDFPVIMLYS